jgi:hypothetical protein
VKVIEFTREFVVAFAPHGQIVGPCVSRDIAVYEDGSKKVEYKNWERNN